jgi:formylglycine-generating enzyme required for sulfatase activity
MSWKLASALIAGFALASSREALAAEDDLSLDLGQGSLDLRRIPKGSFTEGSPVTETGREPDEASRAVTISRSFWLGKVPVTRAQFTRFVSETHHITDAERGQSGGFGWDAKAGALVQRKEFSWRNPGFLQKDDDPVVLVTYGDATAFTAWASRKTGHRVRLPTEAEWEYAARAGTTTPWYAATKDEDTLALGWFKTNSANTSHGVGLRKPNAFGLFDMAGNVYEWCRDIYAPYPPGDVTDPENTTNPGTEPERRVLRGGSFLRDPKRARSAARHRNTPGSRNADNGFRVAVDDDILAPQPTSLPAGAFAPASPLGMSSSSTANGADGAAPAPAPPTRGNEGMAWALVAAPVAAAAAAIAWVLARRRRSIPNALGVMTHAQEDGFWVRAPGLPTGTRVRYTCIVSGVEVSDLVPLDGGEETFVYTGAQPSAIRITEVVSVTSLSYRSSQPGSVTGPAAPRAPLPSDRDSLRASAAALAAQRSSAPPSVPPPISSSSPNPSSVSISISDATDDAPFAGYPSAY